MNQLKEKGEKVAKILREAYPDAHLTLEFDSPFQLLISTVLAARTRDTVVNKVMKELKEKYPNLEGLADARPEDIIPLLKGINMAGRKANHIIHIARIIKEKYGGEVPDTIEELTSLPGVGRKTANVVLGNAMGKVVGIEVDTHIARVSYRLGLTKNTDPDKIEKDLMEVLPHNEWLKFTHTAKQHGREVCRPTSPHCHKCVLATLCDKQGL